MPGRCGDAGGGGKLEHRAKEESLWMFCLWVFEGVGFVFVVLLFFVVWGLLRRVLGAVSRARCGGPILVTGLPLVLSGLSGAVEQLLRVSGCFKLRVYGGL